MTIRLRLIVLAAFIVSSTPLVWAQDEIPTRIRTQNRTGNLPFSSTLGSDIEHVDLATGNLFVKIPLVSIPGRGLDFNFGLTYNALYFVPTQRIDNTGALRMYWNVEYGGLTSIGLGWNETRADLTSVTAAYLCGPTVSGYYKSRFIYTDADRVKHPLAIQQSQTQDCPINDGQGPDLTGVGMLSSMVSNALPIINADGTQFQANINSISGLATTQSQDSNGNSRQETVGLDTLGRQVVVSTHGTNQITYQVYDSNGVQQTYTVNLGTISVATAFNAVPNCGQEGINEYTGTRTVINSIALPNGTSYQFHYETGSFGALTEIDLPTGGSISYTWATLQNGPKSHRFVASRTVAFNGESHTWAFDGTTLTDPLGNQSVYTTGFGDVITNAKFYQGNASGTPLRQYQIDYVYDGDPWYDTVLATCDDEVQPVAARPIRVTTTLDDGRVSKTEFDYETFTYSYHPNHYGGYYQNAVTFTTSRGNASEIREYDYGMSAPGALLRRTDRTYLHNANPAYIPYNIVDKVLSETVYDGASVQRARTDYEYDSTSLVSSTGAPQHDDSDYSSSFTLRGNPTRVKRWRNTDGATLTTTYIYDSLGNIQSITNPRNNTTTYSYIDQWANASCAPPSIARAYVTAITNSLNQRTQFSYYPCSGLKGSRKDENDLENNRAGTTFLYDLLGRLKETDYPDGGHTTVNYTDAVPFLANTTTKINASLNLVGQNEFDGLGRLRVTRLLSDPQGTVYTRTAYDAVGRVSQTWNATRCNPDVGNCGEATYGITQTQYDGLGRVTKVIPPDGSSSSNNISTLYLGNSATVTDQAGNARRSFTDGLGHLSQVTEDPFGLAYSTTYNYDALDDLTGVTQGAQTRTFAYDSLSELVTAVNPENGTMQYTNDADGNVSTHTDARGTVTSYGYDNLDRLLNKTYTIAGSTAATSNVAYGYESLQASCNSQGRLTSVGSSISTTNIGCFDTLGRPTQSNQTTGGTTYSFSYGYDLAGHLTSEIYPSGKIILSAFDGAGRISNVQRGGGNYYAGDGNSNPIQYEPMGAARRILLGNGLFEETRRNNRLQPLQIGLGPMATGLNSTLNTTNSNRLLLGFGYVNGTANNGNLLSQLISIGGTGFSQNYAYDRLNRLATATETSGWSLTYNIDQYGNAKPSDQTFAFDVTKNQMTLVSGYQYDSAGNLAVNAVQQTFAYDAENRQTSFNTGNATFNATYDYDGDGRRVRKIVGGSTTIFVYDAAGRLAADYASDTPQPGTRYLTGDHLGSNRIVTDASGSVLARHDYYPFGAEISSSLNGRLSVSGYSAMDTLRQKFTGKERDTESSGDYFGARYMSASQGRFLSVDPAFESEILELPQTWNRYSYVYNRPMNTTDPDGRCPPCIGAIVGGVVEGGWNLGSQFINNGYSFTGTDWGKFEANVAGGAVAGAIAGATGGLSLVGDALVGAGATVAGGIVERTAEGQNSGDVFSAGEISTDAVSGLVGGAIGHVGADVIHVPEEPALPGSRRHAVGRRKLASYDAAVKARNNDIGLRTGLGVAAGSPPTHAASGAINNFWGILNWLIFAPTPPPEETNVTVTLRF